MKKILLIMMLLSFTLITSLETVSASTDEPYSGYAEASDYERIEKINDQWFGVITASDSRLFAVNSSIDIPFGINYSVNDDYHYFLEFKLTRETTNLKEIKIQFEVDSYCPYITCLFGGRVDAYEETKIFTYDESSSGLEDGKTLEEAFGSGNITASIDDRFDYVVNLDHTTKNKQVDSYVKILEFTYILTDAEVQDLMLDIQAQYEREYYQIITNDFLTASEKQNAINMLNQEYAEYDVDFGEEMESPCIGDGCEDELDGAPELPDLGVIVDLVGLMEYIVQYIPDMETLIAYIVIALIIGYITTSFIYQGTQKVLYSTLDSIAEGIKSVVMVILNVLWYYLNAIFTATMIILSSITNIFR